MTEELRNKLAKVYALVNNGATDGEKAAAKKALERLLEKYKIDEAQLNDIGKNEYECSYATNLDLHLFSMLIRLIAPGTFFFRRLYDKHFNNAKRLVVECTYYQWVEIECTYEYFRRHMKKEWIRVALPQIAKLRNKATKAKRRKHIEDVFINRYFIASNLYLPKMLSDANYKGQQYKDALKMGTVEGGKYHKQVASSHLLTNQL